MFKISVIVPVWGVEKYLEKCLQSLIDQTIRVKIIVVNDSSPDNSQKIIDEFKANYPEQIETYIKPNGGIADTRNFGLSKVNTEYFGFLDSDDYVDKTMYEKMLKNIEDNQSDMSVCDFWWVHANKNVLGKEGHYVAGKDMMVKLMATLWNKLYRTRVIRESGVQFPTGYRYEDAYFLYALVPYINKVSFVNEPLVYYVQRQGSITHTNNDKVKDMIYVFDKLLSFYEQRNLRTQYNTELEYLFIKFFLGNSFLRTIKIENKTDREEILDMSFNILIHNFPNYYNNPYLKILGGNKNRYYKIVRKWNYKFFALVFRLIK